MFGGTSDIPLPLSLVPDCLASLHKMSLKFFSALIALSSIIFAAPAPETQSSEDVSFKSSIREKLDGAPAGWTKDESIDVDKNSMMSLRIHLAHQDMDKFHELAMNVCDPIHEVRV